VTDDPRRPKPLFRVFDRDPDRHRLLDRDYVQTTFVRLHRPGPWRTALVVLLAFTAAWASLAAVLAVTVARTFLAKLVVVGVVALPLVALYLLTARILSVGVYANDWTLKQNRVGTA
jgi:predicted anti-sigma-YlaC factor YlaD